MVVVPVYTYEHHLVFLLGRLTSHWSASNNVAQRIYEHIEALDTRSPAWIRVVCHPADLFVWCGAGPRRCQSQGRTILAAYLISDRKRSRHAR